jgi:hypothetical protein
MDEIPHEPGCEGGKKQQGCGERPPGSERTHEANDSDYSGISRASRWARRGGRAAERGCPCSGRFGKVARGTTGSSPRPRVLRRDGPRGRRALAARGVLPRTPTMLAVDAHGGGLRCPTNRPAGAGSGTSCARPSRRPSRRPGPEPSARRSTPRPDK